MGQDCKYCGAYISGGEERCPACGKRVKNASAGTAAAQAPEMEDRWSPRQEEPEQEKSYTYTYKDEYERRYGENGGQVRSTPGVSRRSEDADVRENRALCYLCYFGPLFLIPYLLRRDSDFVRFHSNQGLLLLIACVLINIVSEIVPFLGWLIGLIGGFFVLVCFVKGLMSVSKGEKNKLPVIGDISLLK